MKYILLFLSLGLASILNAQTSIALLARVDFASIFGSPLPDNESGVHFNRPFDPHSSFGLNIVHMTEPNQAVVIGFEYATGGISLGKDLTERFCNCIFYKSQSYTRYEFIGLPLGYRFYAAEGNWHFYAQTSLIPMAYLQTEVEVYWDDREVRNETLQSEDFRDFHLASSAAVGVQKSFAKSWYFGLQPTFRVHLTPLTNQRSNVRPWTAGLQLNIGKQL